MVGMQYAVRHHESSGFSIHKRTCLVYRARLEDENWTCFYTKEDARAYVRKLHGTERFCPSCMVSGGN